MIEMSMPFEFITSAARRAQRLLLAPLRQGSPRVPSLRPGWAGARERLRPPFCLDSRWRWV